MNLKDGSAFITSNRQRFAATVEAQREHVKAVPSHLDATTEREKMERMSLEAAGKKATHRLRMAEDVFNMHANQLIKLYDWREQLLSTSRALRVRLEELFTECGITPPYTPDVDRTVNGGKRHEISAVMQALAAIDHFRCLSVARELDSCGMLFTEPVWLEETVKQQGIYGEYEIKINIPSCPRCKSTSVQHPGRVGKGSMLGWDKALQSTFLPTHLRMAPALNLGNNLAYTEEEIEVTEAELKKSILTAEKDGYLPLVEALATVAA